MIFVVYIRRVRNFSRSNYTTELNFVLLSGCNDKIKRGRGRKADCPGFACCSAAIAEGSFTRFRCLPKASEDVSLRVLP